MKLYVAVVYRPGYKSLKPHGQWASFVSSNKNTAIESALKAAREWSPAENKYSVRVGTLTSEVRAVQQYELVPLEGK